MKTIKTLSSTYEVDEEQRRVRRVSGTGTIPSILEEDGRWAEYKTSYPNEWGGIFFVNAQGKGFITSTVLGVEEE